MKHRRVRVDFKTSFVSQTPTGQVFDWLLQEYGTNLRNVIVNAVTTFYRPAMIAEMGGSSEDIEMAIAKAQKLLDSEALAARNNCTQSLPSAVCEIRSLPAALDEPKTDDDFFAVNEFDDLED